MAENTTMIEKVEQVSKRGLDHLPTRKGPEVTAGEKAEELWGLFSEYSAFRRGLYKEGLKSRKGDRSIREVPGEEKEKVLEQVGQNPLVQRLEGEISNLWQDPQVRGIFVAKVRESLEERKEHTDALKDYRGLRGKVSKLEDEYFDLLRNQFLMRRMAPTLRAMDMSVNRVERAQVAREIVDLETTGGMPKKLLDERKGLDKEHADLAALLGYERIFDYHRQFKTEGIVLTPSRESLLDEVAKNTSAGTWMLLVGETGSGKTTFAKTTSHILNGEPPQYASGERWGDVRTLIGTKTMDATGRVYYEFGPLTVALTGHHNSLEMDEAIRSGQEAPGKLFLADELNKFDQDALYGALKIVNTLHPGEEFSFKELPGVRLRKAKKGFAIIATMNPSSVRYDRKELEAPIERLFYDGKRVVDYLPMTDQNPELYDVFLASLMDNNGRIRVAQSELSPSYISVEDKSARITKQELNPDINQHGALYRFALAVAEVHKSFNQKDSIAKTVTDDGFLEKTVLDMGILMEWMNGYASQVEGGQSLTAYFETKLQAFFNNIESVNDQEIFKRIFSHFGFNKQGAENTPKPYYTPLTPTEIGYLTPRTPRGVKKEGKEVIPRAELYIDLETGDEIRYLPEVITEEKYGKLTGVSRTYIRHGEIIHRDNQDYVYLGIDPENGDAIFLPYREGMGFTKPSSTEANRSQDRMAERAKEILGSDFLGIEAIRSMESRLKAVGVNVEFSLDNMPAIPYSEKDLELAKQNGEMLVLRAENARINGKGSPLTLINFRELFRKDPVGSIATLFYSFRPDANDWYQGQDFATKPGEVKLGWAIVKKDLLPDSKSKTWDQQEEVLKQYAEDLKKRGATNAQVRRRTAMEATWDSMLYYINNKNQLLGSTVDWTSSRTSDGHLVGVGDFASDGLLLSRWRPSGSLDLLGVCPSR